MAFCTFCGKQLADGEVCSCCQQAAPQYQQTAPQYQQTAPQYQQTAPQYQQAATPGAVGNGFKEFGKLIKGTFTKPFEAAEEFFEKASIAGSSIALISVLLGYILSAYAVVLGQYTHALATFKSQASIWGTTLSKYLKAMGYTSKDIAAQYGITGLDFAQAFFMPLIWMIIMCGVTVGLYFAVNAMFIKKKANIKKLMAFCAAPAVALLVSALLKIITAFIFNDVDVIFTIIGTVVSILILFMGLINLKKVITGRYKFFFAVIITAATYVLANFLILKVCHQSAGWFFGLPF